MTEENKNNLIENLSARTNSSWLFSDSFIKRSLAITGYNIVGGLIIYICLVVITFFIGVGVGLII